MVSQTQLDFNTPIALDKKTILSSSAFNCQSMHGDILQHLLSELKPVNFGEIIGLEAGKELKQKHIVFAVVKHLLLVAKDRKWNLCKVFDYTYIYNGAYWKQCSKDDIKKFLSDAAVKMGCPDYEAKQYEFTDKLLKQFLSDAHFPAPEPDSNKVLINLHNGTFEFTNDGFKQREFNPDDFLTYQLPFDYEENATCPLFEKYLLQVLPDESSRLVLQEFAGFIFTKMNLEKCLVLTGEGGNGKTVFFDILNALIGINNILNYSIGLFREPYNRAKLTNVLLNYSDEKGFDLNADMFKNLVSGTPVQACEKYCAPFTLRNKVKFIFNCNKLPSETESTEAYYRRFLIIPFDVKISDEIKDIHLSKRIIHDELPGAFNWVLAGLNRLLGQQKFTYCERAERALGEFRRQGDHIQLFIEENHYQTSAITKEPITSLYIKYRDFCKDEAYKPHGKNNFSKELERKGFEKVRIGGTGAAAFMIEMKKEL